jgi:hypothetical protein
MTCLLCGSANLAKFSAEMIIHFSGLKNLDKPGVWVFPKLLICLDCGFSRFAVPECELGLLAGDTPTREGSTVQESVYDVAPGSGTALRVGQ